MSATTPRGMGHASGMGCNISGKLDMTKASGKFVDDVVGDLADKTFDHRSRDTACLQVAEQTHDLFTLSYIWNAYVAPFPFLECQ